MFARNLGLCLCFPLAAWCQKPVIHPGGVVNAASYTTTTITGGPVGQGLSGGSIVSIFGTNLAASTQTASMLPLPIALAGTSVTANGVAVPLFYVSPGQINFQLPSRWPVLPSSQWTGIVVSTAVGSSDPYPLDGAGAEGIFTRDASGCGQGAVLNVRADGSVSINSPANSVSPGEYVSVYGTGLGIVYNPPPDGMPAPSSPLAIGTGGWGMWFDFGRGVIAPGALYWEGQA